MVDLASRRGLFGWIAGLLAAPAAARSAGAEPARVLAVSELVQGEAMPSLAPAFGPSAAEYLTLTDEIVRSVRARTEARAASVCRTPSAFAVFMRERLGDQSMIPVGSMTRAPRFDALIDVVSEQVREPVWRAPAPALSRCENADQIAELRALRTEVQDLHRRLGLLISPTPERPGAS